jgi:hypothetical protein
VEILHCEREISVDAFSTMLREMTELLHATSGHIEMTFPYFVMKKAPVSATTAMGTPASGSRSWCPPPACAPARRRFPTTERTISARTSP